MKLEDIGWVTGQFVLGGALLLAPSGGHWIPRPYGLVFEWGAWIVAGSVLLLAASNLGKALTPAPTPKEGSELVSHGLYSLVRHPMYSAILLACWLFALPASGPWRWALTLGLTLFFTFKARREEAHLASSYSGYKDYMSRVPRFVPRPSLLSKSRPPRSHS